MSVNSIFTFAKKGDLESLVKLFKEQEQLKDELELENNRVDSRDLWDFTVLHIACKYGHLMLVEYIFDLLTHTPFNLNNSRTISGDTCLILASMNGHINIVKFLVSKGADVNLSNDHGNTALHYLCFYRYIDIIGYLLKESPLYVNTLNKYGKSPLDKCNTEFKKRVLKLLPGPLGNAIFAKRRSFTEIENESKAQFLAKVTKTFEIPFTSIISPEEYKSSFKYKLYKGTIHGHLKVFIKEVSPKFQALVTGADCTSGTKHNTVDEIRILRDEIKFLRQYPHRSLSTIIAACLTPPHICTMTEFVDTGNLFDLIRDPKVDLSPEQAVKIAIEIAIGMEFLHSNKICHYNLKSSNILITMKKNIILTDYGYKESVFSKFPRLTHSVLSPISIDTPTAPTTTTHPSIPDTCSQYPNYREHISNPMAEMLFDVAWIAPEVLIGLEKSKNVGEKAIDFYKADVYSFGTVLFEILTREDPYPDMNSMRVGLLVVNSDMRPTIPEFVPGILTDLMLSTWYAPSTRPDFTTCFKKLQNCLDSFEMEISNGSVNPLEEIIDSIAHDQIGHALTSPPDIFPEKSVSMQKIPPSVTSYSPSIKINTVLTHPSLPVTSAHSYSPPIDNNKEKKDSERIEKVSAMENRGRECHDEGKKKMDEMLNGLDDDLEGLLQMAMADDDETLN